MTQIVMKTLTGVMLMAMSLPAVAARVVTMPRMSSSQFGGIIRSVEITDTAAVLNMSFLHIPGYWCSLDSLTLRGCVTGHAYGVRAVRGYEFGERKVMPGSGRYDFAVEFEAPEPADVAVDVMEADAVLVGGLDLSGTEPEAACHTRITGIHPASCGFVALFADGWSRVVNGQDKLWVPVDDGKFEYHLYTDEPVVYCIANGPDVKRCSYSHGRFFSEPGQVEVNFVLDVDSLDGDSSYSVEVQSAAGTLTQQLSDYDMRVRRFVEESAQQQRYDSLMAAEAFYVPQYNEAVRRFRSHPEERDSLTRLVEALYDADAYLTPEGRAATAAMDCLFEEEYPLFRIAEAEKATPAVGLYALASMAWYMSDTAPVVDAWRRTFADRHAGGPYDGYLATIAATSEPLPGNAYIDFEAPDAEGARHRLSELIAGRPALIDLWASWCGPCRRSSISMIPVYEEFAPKGFVIVGVAREYGSTKAVEAAIEKDGYPWLNLVELDDAASIWAKYRVANAAGSTWLVGPDGRIVAVNPTAEQVRSYLADTLHD